MKLKKMKRLLPILLVPFIVTACAETQYASHLAKQIVLPSDTPKTVGYYKVGKPYKIKGVRYYPKEEFHFSETGIASWYGPNFHGKQTANGEIFDKYELTAAHRTLQMPSLVRVTNLENGKSLVVRVNDRGPFAHNRIIDLSERSAELLGFKQQGTARVKVDVLTEESKILSQVAKRGESTAGYEVAYNRDGRLPNSALRHVNLVSTDVTPSSPADGKHILASSKPVTPVQAQLLSTDNTVYPHGQRERARFQDVIQDYGSNNEEAVQKKAAVFPRNEMEAMALPHNSVIPARKPQGALSGHNEGGRFMPDPVVSQVPVKPTSLFVQAGSFTTFENAQALKSTLNAVGPTIVQTVDIQGRTFYRVRIGPYDSIDAADSAMNRLEQKGRIGTIVVVD